MKILTIINFLLALFCLGYAWYVHDEVKIAQKDTDNHNDQLKKLKDKFKEKGLIDDTQ